MMRSLVCLTICFLGGLSLARADNWSGWRGPLGDGSSPELDVPTHWSPEENVRWKTPLPVTGHSSPITFGGRVFLLGVDLEQNARYLLALDQKNGELLWKKKVLVAPLEMIHQLNSHASSTPAADAEHVYATFLDVKQMLVVAYDHEGSEIWRVHPGVFSSKHGFCSSPVLYQDLVIVNGDHDGDAYIVALDRKTGDVRWKTPRENKTRSYCTPIIRNIEGREQLLLSGSKSVASFDPATGKRHWVIDGPTEQFVASLVYQEGLLFVTGGYPDKHMIAIDPTGSGNVTESHVRWRLERSGVSYVPSPVAANGYFLIASDEGLGTCIEAKTGKIQWQKRLGRHYSASLVTANGLVYFLDDDGITKVVRPGPEFEQLSENQLGVPCYSSPAISDGTILIRSEQILFCIGKKSEEK